MRSKTLGIATVVVAGLVTVAAASASPYDLAVEADNPLAYFNFANSTTTQTGTETTDAVNGHTLELQGGATIQPGVGPVINGSNVPALVLNGTTASALSGGNNPLNGGISNAGSITAWINLAQLPSNGGRNFSIAGESQNGNDFDLQIDGNTNGVQFFTSHGGATSAPAFNASNLGQWIFVAATFTANNDRSVYINGQLVAQDTDTGGGKLVVTASIAAHSILVRAQCFRGGFLTAISPTSLCSTPT
jgi:hypothetical protein